jgi:hypothetical protein
LRVETHQPLAFRFVAEFERKLPMDVGPVLYILIIVLVVLAILYLFQRVRK